MDRQNIFQVTLYVLDLTVFFATILVIGYFFWSVLTWLTSGGDPLELEAARGKITGSIVGAVILTPIYIIIWPYSSITRYTLPIIIAFISIIVFATILATFQIYRDKRQTRIKRELLKKIGKEEAAIIQDAEDHVNNIITILNAKTDGSVAP